MKNFNSFGVMLDCSRNGVMNIPSVKKFIDILAKLGYNQLMLYTEDTYEVPDYPYFGYFRGKYLKAQLKEIDDYAYNNGVELVPCIQTLAHFTAPKRWDFFFKMNDIDDILMIGEEETYKFIEAMFSSLRECFHTDKIHIGMDEADNVGRGKYLNKNGLVNRTDILLSHLEKVCEIADKYNFKPMMWSDMFFKAAFGSYYIEDENTTLDPSIKDKIPDNLSLVYWDYYGLNKSRYDIMIRNHFRICDKVVFAGGAWKWACFAPKNGFSIKANEAAIKSCIENGIKDMFITLWGDNGDDCSAFSVLPTLVHASCMAKGITDEKEIKKVFTQVTGENYDDFMLFDHFDRFNDNIEANFTFPSRVQLYNDCFTGMYDDAYQPEDEKYYTELAKKLHTAELKSKEYKYLFNLYQKLAEALVIKGGLGRRTRELYSTDNKIGLEEIIKDYDTAIKKINEFYKAFKIRWFKENKPNGFEVQDLRLGGLVARLNTCKERLVDYCSGKIDTIEELCEAPIKRSREDMNISMHTHIVSPNAI